MNKVELNAVLRLRRDNDYNYAKIKDTFIPENGEICLVDTARDGLRAVCGNGSSVFSELEFIDNFVIKAYFYEGAFYKDVEHTEEILGSTNKIYIDRASGKLYYYDDEFIDIKNNIPTATAEIPGIMKLYHTTGSNTDGTMTQKAITDELNEKVELTLNQEEETLIFSWDN